MNLSRLLVLGLGVVLGTTGLVLVFAPSVSVGVRVPSVAVASVALLALVLTLLLGRARLRDDHRVIALPTPERRTHTVAGETIDRRIAALSMDALRGSGDSSPAYSALRTRMKRVARSILSTPEESRVDRQLSAGTWTDDLRTAAFLTDAPLRRLSVGEHLHSLRTGEPPVQRRARRAIAALVRRLDTAQVPRSDDQAAQGEEPTAQPLPAKAKQSTETERSEETLRVPDAGETVSHRTGRWQGVSALALAIGAGGMLLRRPALLLVGGIGVGLAAYSRAASPPTVTLEIERTISDLSPAVEAAVRVTVTVRNVGDDFLPDCSVIDGVPPGLLVTDGSPRHGTALRPGTATTFSYTLTAARGEHTFTPPAVIARNFSGSAERLTRVEPSGETTIACVPRLEPLETVQLRPHTTQFHGRARSDTGGTGVEFYAVREHQPGDPRSRIDWNRLAKTGELSTLQFRVERTTTVVIVIDARNAASLAPSGEQRSAVERSVGAAGRLFATLLDANVSVGITALSEHPQACWLAPDRGDAHRRRGRRLLGSHPALAVTPVTPDDREHQCESSFERLFHRLPAAGQVVVLSPLCDDAISESIQRLETLGHPVTVISPDPTALTSPGGQLVHTERALRIARLRYADIPVLDWRYVDEPLSTAIDRLGRHISRTGPTTNAGWSL